MNDKMMGDLEKIQEVGRYFIEIWRASGLIMSNVKFLWASNCINNESNRYWLKVIDVARSVKLNRIKKTCKIMGRKDQDNLQAAQIMYPCM